MIERFETGKWYRYTGGRNTLSECSSGWNPCMNIVFNKGVLFCYSGDGKRARFSESWARSYVWAGVEKYFEEVVEEYL